MQSTIPPLYPMATHLTRTVIHPYGRKASPSYTLSLYDTGVPHGDGPGHWFGYRLYEHVRGQKSTVLFQDADQRGNANTGDVMLQLIDRLTTRPGDTLGEGERALTPAQLNFLVSHAGALRAEARRRFGWEAKLVHLRSDLEALYTHRQLRGQGPRHRMALGVLSAAGSTKTEAKRGLEQALGAHASALPRFQIGGVTGVVYAQYQHGADTVIQIVNPKNPESPLGDSARFQAKNRAEADEITDTFVAEAERAERGSNRPPSLRPRARAERSSIRATS